MKCNNMYSYISQYTSCMYLHVSQYSVVRSTLYILVHYFMQTCLTLHILVRMYINQELHAMRCCRCTYIITSVHVQCIYMYMITLITTGCSYTGQYVDTCKPLHQYIHTHTSYLLQHMHTYIFDMYLVQLRDIAHYRPSPLQATILYDL